MRNVKKRVLIYKKSNLINSSGGIEKYISWFANELAKNGYDVYVATRDKKKGNLFYPLNKEVVFYQFIIKFSRLRRILGQLGLSFVHYFNRERYVAKMIREYCNEIKPNYIITEGIQDLADIIYYEPYPCKKIVQLHSEPSIFFTPKKKKLFTWALRKADMVQVLFESFIPMIKKYYQGKIVVIGNPVLKNNLSLKREPIIIYPARIEQNKQQHLLIEAFAIIASKFPSWKIHFWGSINNEKYFKLCQDTIKKYNLNSQIYFKGTTKQIDSEIAKSAICAFPSRYEGFSLALTEAMAAGLPCIGMKTTSGVNELIQDNKNGFLVDDVNELAEKLKILIENKDLREKIGSYGKRVSKIYSPDEIIKKWKEVLDG